MIEADRLVSESPLRTDVREDPSIRPKKLNDYIGQETITQQLALFIQAARQRGSALDHVLLFGPPGLGKTTLSHIIANEMGSEMSQTAGPVIDKAGDLAGFLTNLQPNDVLFIDEIHRLNPSIEEILYPAMEDGKLDIVLGEGPAARSIKIDLPPFTLIGATTRAGLLTSPLRDRFGIVHRLAFYDHEALTTIVSRSAAVLNIETDLGGAHEIAKRSRGTPRIANRLLRRVRDYAEVKHQGCITQSIANDALAMLDIDHQGLDPMDRYLLLTLIDKFEGGPVGIDNLAAAMSEDRHTLEDVIEPFLIQQGFIHRTARGRVASAHAYQHFHRSNPNDKT